jgi:hypothetical protein
MKKLMAVFGVFLIALAFGGCAPGFGRPPPYGYGQGYNNQQRPPPQNYQGGYSQQPYPGGGYGGLPPPW